MVTKRLIYRIFAFLFVIIFTLAGIPGQTANAAGEHISQQAKTEKAPAQGGLKSSASPLSIGLNGTVSTATDGQALKSAIPPLIVLVDPNPTMQGIRAPVEPKLQAAIDAAGVHSAAAGATFSFTFQPAGSADPWGAVCQTFPETAKVAFTAAAAIWSYFIQSTVPITISACWSSPAYMSSADTLGYSGGEGYFKNFTGAPKPDTWYESSLANALHGSDLDPSGFDDYITYNSGFPWYYGTDGNVPAGLFDLVTVAAHEIAHGLNFSGTASYSAGTGSYGGGTGFPNIYDTFIEDSGGTKLTAYTNPSTALGALLTSNNLWFDGANASAGNGGVRVKIYAPSPWAGGSSFSHLDYSYAGSPNSMMVYAIGSGSSQHNPGPITQGLLKDLGWVLDEQAALHVKPVASGTDDCSSWANACTLQTALSVAASGDKVWVAKGTYKPTDGMDRWASFQLKSGVAVYGGFAGTEVALAQRNLPANVTILSGDIGTAGSNSDNSYSVVNGSGTDTTAILDGFTISGGNGDCPCAGGGMYNNAGSPSLANLIFSSNSAGWGGGMFNDASNPSLTNITFNSNSATNTGGGMENQDNSNPSLTNVTFNSNTASWGGGMANYSGLPSLTNVTFSSNSASVGAGMYNNASSPTLASATFSTNNASANGGGMYNDNGSAPNLTEVTLSNNSASNDGGGMYNTSSSPTLTDVTFSGNTNDGNGAGMYNFSSSPTLTKVTFDSNAAYSSSGNGGGMYNDSSSPTLTDVTFSSNTAANNGGGMNNANVSNPILTDVTFNGNSALAYGDGSGGGGIYNASSTPTLTNVTFSSNASSDSGGGISNDASNPTLTNVTFSGNSASFSGGGMYNLDSSPIIRDTIIWGNTASMWAQINDDGESTPTVSSSDVQGGYAGTGNLDLDPLLGDLGYYGGNTQVLSVQPGSPAIDAGDNATCASTDQRGVSRPQGPHCDMGAFEAMQNLTGRLYVVPSGGAERDCASWSNACSLQYALAAAGPGAEMWVKTGVYTPTARTDRSVSFQLKSGVAVYGGFGGTETARSQRDPHANLTSLSGDIGTAVDNSDNSYHVVIGSGTDATAVLDGFTISAGNASGVSPDDAGAGMLIDAGSPTLTSLVFSDNDATYGGGGLHNTSGSSPSLNRITFSGNSAGTLGGGMLNNGSGPALTNVTFTGNTAGWGGGMYNGTSSPTLNNVTFSDNSATGSGGGMDNSNSNPTIRNSILWGNSAPSYAQIFNEAGSAPTVTYSDVQGGYSGATNLILDPFLGSPDYYGGSTPVFPLLPGSPAIDAGEDATCPSTDQRGLSRPQGVHCDMGAFEALSTASSLYVIPSGGANLTCASWSNACDLQYALAAANPGSEIWVKAGLYKPTSGTDRSVSFQLKNGVAIYGGFAGTETDRSQRDPYVNWTGLSGDIGAAGDNSDNSYHVVVASNTNATAVLDGFNIQDGNTSGASADNAGGGMYNDSGSPTLANLAFNNNTAITTGGGMYNIAGNPTLTDVSFNTNSAIIGGGGMYNESSNPILLDTSFYGNSAPNGGGIFNWSSSPSLTNITFSNNTGGSGGGMDNEIDSSPTLTDVTFIWNSADSMGGGMINAGTGSPVLTNVTFHGNAADLGGGVYNGSTSNPSLNNVTIAGNNASSQGGGIYNSTHGNTIIRNSIIWDNNAPSDAQIFNDSIGSLMISYSDIQGSTTGSINLDPLLGSLSTYGTMQVLPLQNGSPAIDAGEFATCASTDQRGLARLQNEHCDMGAFEKVAGDRLYVIPNGATSGTCATWANACELRYALFIASAGSEVWVKGGTYTPTGGTDRKATFQLNSGVAIYGGFAGTETARSQRNPGIHLTTLSGDIGVSGAGSPSSSNPVPGSAVNGTPTLGGFSLPADLGASVGDGDTLTLSIPGDEGAVPSPVSPAPTDNTPTAASTSNNSILSLPGNEAGASVAAENSTTGAEVAAASGNSDNSFHVVRGDGANDSAVLDGFSISGGNANGIYPYNAGGGMANSFGSPSLANITFTGNTAGWGGGMAISNGSPTLTNITFSNNSSTNNGGGMEIQDNSSPTLTDVTFSRNTSDWGGGMSTLNGSTPSLTNVTFSNNSVPGGGGGMFNNTASTPTLNNVTFGYNSATDGGGIYNMAGSNPTLTEVTFGYNSAAVNGGGLYNNASSPIMTNINFTSNTASYGGGIYNNTSNPSLTSIFFYQNSANNQAGGGIFNNTSNPSLTEVNFTGNTAKWGGGIYNYHSAPHIDNTTFSFNAADSYGGGIEDDTSSPVLTNVTFGGNHSTWGGGGLFNGGDSHSTIRDSIFWGNWTNVISITYYGTVINPSQIYNNAGSTSTSPITYSDILGGCPYHSDTCANIITSDPLLGDLGYYGNRTAFFPLGSGSPAINSAENATCAAYDQRGVSRPQGGTCDMGTFEQINGRLYAISGGATRGSAIGTCNSWANGCELRYALDIAGSGSEIWAAAGTYTSTAGTDRSVPFQLLNGVAIYGGFGGYETTRDQRNPYTHLTTLSGDIGAPGDSSDNSYNVVIGSGTDTTAILDGFTIQDGYANGSDPQNVGGGMYINNGIPTLANLSLSGNAAVWGGGMYLAGSSPTLTEVTFSNNTAVENGGGMENYISNPTLFNVSFINNTAANGGGIFNTQGNATITNVTFSGNNAGAGGGVFNDNSAPIFTNVTFGNNSATYAGGGIFNTTSSPLIRDSIFWNSPVMDSDSASTPTIQFSLIQGGCPTYATCTNISTSNPLLGSLGAYGGKTQVLPLLPGSAAIDQGNNTSCASTDQRGVGRPQNGTCDMGAFEAHAFSLTVTGGNNQSTSINTAFAQPLALSVGGTNGDPVNGGVVSFTAPVSGASAALASNPVTIISGAVSVNATANGVSGSYDVIADASSVVSPVLFHLTNISAISPTPTRTRTITTTPTRTASQTPTPTQTRTATAATSTRTPTATPTRTVSWTQTSTQTSTSTLPTSTRTTTATPTRTASQTQTSTQTRTGTQSTSTRTPTATPSAVYYHIYLPLTLKETAKP